MGSELLPQHTTQKKKSALLLLSLSKSSFSFSFSFSSSFVCVCVRVKKQRRGRTRERRIFFFFSSLGSIPKGERRETHLFRNKDFARYYPKEQQRLVKMATTKRWLEHLHAREEQRRRKMMMGKNPDEEEDALFNPNNVDLGRAMLSCPSRGLPCRRKRTSSSR